MNKFLNYYACNHEGTSHFGECIENWQDESECTNNDRCPVCNAEIEPYESEDIYSANAGKGNARISAYEVIWRIDVDAENENEREAALQAEKVQRDGEGERGVFEVRSPGGKVTLVDLSLDE